MLKANNDAALGDKIIVSVTCSREDGTESTVEEKRLEITVQKETITLTAQQIANNPKAYYGKEVENYKASDSDKNTYRIFYVSTRDNEFGDPQYTIYLKADCSGNYVLSTAYNSDTKVKEMNPLWAEQRGTEKWNDYVIGAPSVEMYVKSYNQTHDKDDEGNEALGCQYQTNAQPGYGYKTYGSINGYGWDTGNVLDYTNMNSMYCKPETYWWLASPCSYGTSEMCLVYSISLGWSASSYPYISPIISLKSDFQPKIEKE